MVPPNTTFLADKVVLHPRDDPLNILDIDTSRKIEKFILAFQPCVVVIGLSTNVVSGLVFWCQGLRDRMNLCLFCLTLADFAYLITIVIVITVSSIIAHIDSRLATEYNVKAIVYGIGFMFGFAALSRLISMVIAVERCACVVFPLQAASVFRTRTMVFVLVAILTFVLLCYSTKPVGIEARAVKDNVTGEIQWMSAMSAFYTNNYLFCQVLYNITPRVFIPVATFVVIVLATFITVVRLRAAMAWRQQTTSSTSDAQGQQMALTKMLVVLSCVDITCSTPSVIQAMLEICRSDFLTGGPFYNLVRTTGNLSTVFICINSSVNFFVYFGRSTRFRHQLERLCCCRQLSCTADKAKSLGRAIQTKIK